MKASGIVTLLVGAVIGFSVGYFVKDPSSGPAAVAVAPGGQAPGAAPARQRVDDSKVVYKVPVDGSPVSGPSDALITIVEFSDYECPFCSRANATVKELQKEYGNKMRVVMKQNPLSFHPNAKPAALAALAAGEQGKYWEMHEKLFENNKALHEASLEKYAKDIGLDVAKWKATLGSSKLSAIIDNDTKLARSLGATGTPAFFINGRRLSGAQPKPNFVAVINEVEAQAQALVKSGTPANQVYAKTIANGATTPPQAPAGAAAPAAPTPAAPSAPPPGKVQNVEVPATAPFTGPKFAKVTIVMFSDFQCPFCSRVEPTLKQVRDTYKNDVKIVWRDQPLSFHNNAKIAAEAARAAHEQGKFWQFHEKLFANQSALDRPNLEKYAQELGLNMPKFKQALDSGKFRALVEADATAGTAVGASGTPTFFVNGKQLVGAQPFDSFKTVIDAELAAANAMLAKGVKLESLYTKLIEEAANAPAPTISIKDAPVKGAKNAPVTIVAFSDFQCPFCSRAVPTLAQIEKDYPGKVKLAFKHQPLPFHNNAKIAAAASMAANEQGKFWEYHDKLFANQQALDRANLEKYAKDLGLDVAKFNSVLDSNKYDSLISADSAEGNRLGANGTPTFFINGRQLVGAVPVEQFKAIIDDELKKAK